MLGVFGKKIGMTQVFSEDGDVVPVTIIKTDSCVVTQVREATEKKPAGVQIGTGKNMRGHKAQNAYFKKLKMDTPEILKEMKVEKAGDFSLGQTWGLEMFEGVTYLDITGRSKGKGFQGVIKRHGFHGGPKTHGSNFHRRPGSIGNCSDPSRVFKGKKMPGQMGSQKVTVQNCKLVKVDKENHLLLVKGPVPGMNRGRVWLKKAVKAPLS